MQVYLQRSPQHAEPVSYYRLALQQDLFAGWSLAREWGQHGGRSQVKHEQFAGQTEAMAALEKHRDAQLKRGFVVVPSPELGLR